jgi:hypothetical protein
MGDAQTILQHTRVKHHAGDLHTPTSQRRDALARLHGLLDQSQH